MDSSRVMIPEHWTPFASPRPPGGDPTYGFERSARWFDSFCPVPAVTTANRSHTPSGLLRSVIQSLNRIADRT